ncbi:MAG: twin-arginine translocase subunit TatC [Actinobacteria bacterium]|nr:twin-arginine translocase subunit TatC [Actinomycetota bacterium]MBV9253068.1 twin-arginine translocase subunit TatC [Actinomycetota bacterium]MBV9664561.1 twin-arginine translocase subunit TatC [Actinomycetota bacterium]
MTTVADPEQLDTAGGRMTLIEHLTELRRRIVMCAIAVALGGVIAFVFYNHILNFLIHPYCSISAKNTKCTLFIQDPLEGFATRLKVAGYVGLFLASPVVLFQMWRFITPGLHPKEKKYAIPFVISSIFLFIFGAVIAMLTFPQALHFLIAVGGPNLQTIFSPAKYLNLILLMIVAFGVAFEFPVVLVFLELAGVLSTARLKQWRRPAIVVIFVIAAVITPSQDPYSLFAMAIPMCLFYEASILIGRLLKK